MEAAAQHHGISHFRAKAKLNLSLRVLGPRADGYHNLETLIAFTNLGDGITVLPAPDYALEVTGLFAMHAPCDERNLVSRAVAVMERAAGRRAEIRVRLNKCVPAGAGMGAGSGDAACVMQALNARWEHMFTLEELCAMGLELGAELPVMLRGQACLVSGIGETLAPVTLPELHAVVAWPGAGLATADVFKAYRHVERPGDAMDWQHGQNDLTETALALAPHVGAALAALPGSRMTGSGAAVFVLHDDAEAAKETAARLAAAHSDWWVRDCVVNPQ